jgi:uncharacterized protein
MTDFAATDVDDWDMVPAAPTRIATVDIVRGVAVMGILAMNIVAFSMPFQAYMNPTAYGLESQADLGSWLFSFIFVDGKMRGLFSFLFGASTLLVIQQARAAGESPAKIHYARMFWLLIFGLIHFYFIWFGDILTMYALTGLILFFFRDLSVRTLIVWGVALLLVQCTLMAGGAWQVHQFATAMATPHPDPDIVTAWQGFEEAFGRLNGQQLTQNMALFLGPWDGLVQQRLVVQGLEPFTGAKFFLAETLAYMLFGMAALKSGFFRGEWSVARYRKWALIGFAIAIPAYAVLAWLLIRDGFTVPMIFTISLGATTPFRPIMVIAIAATIILLTRKGGWLVDRIAAAGRAAFTNYLGTSLLMTTFFYGYGLGWYGHLTRIQLWLPVLGAWVIMLLWSKPWLDRFNYGPFEWLWRSLARARFQPMRKHRDVSSGSSA